MFGLEHYGEPSSRMRSEGYGSCRCVCVSVKSHLTLGGCLRPENAATYLAGDEGQKFVAFSLTLRRSRATALAALYGHRTTH